jgi:AAA domain
VDTPDDGPCEADDAFWARGHHLPSDVTGTALGASADGFFFRGANVVPVGPAGTAGEKQPAKACLRPNPDTGKLGWTHWQRERIKPGELATWLRGRPPGIGVICGAISQNLIMVELEGRAVADGYAERVGEKAEATGLDELWTRLTAYEEETPTVGTHWYAFVSGECPHSDVLARRPGPDPARPFKDSLVLAEVKGEGGFSVVAGSGPECHPAGRGWTVTRGTPADIATLTAEQFAQLRELIADTIDEMPDPPPPAPRRPVERRPGERTPADAWAEVTTWNAILEPHDWVEVTNGTRSGDRQKWRRPGKRFGVSAVTGGRHDVLVNFSSSVAEFTPVLAGGPSYSKLAVHTILNHGGDYSAAVRELRRLGYGDERPRSGYGVDYDELDAVFGPDAEAVRAAYAAVVPGTVMNVAGPIAPTRTPGQNGAASPPSDGNSRSPLETHACDETAGQKLTQESPQAQPAASASPTGGLERLSFGASSILDAPTTVPALWGQGDEILWPEGEALMICGPPGVGKTTLTGQLLRGRLGLGDGALLGYPVKPGERRVLYLAMDRPRQIARSLRRQFNEDDRKVLDERLAWWSGPPPNDLAQYTDLMLRMAEDAEADTIIVDSLKDAAIGLSDDAVGAGYNRARQRVLAAGVQVLELHHQVKRNAAGGKPDSIADVYGSAWLTAGAGSVILLWGEAGDPVVDLRHLKPSIHEVGPYQIQHSPEGTTTVVGGVDLVTLARTYRPSGGLTVEVAATRLFGVGSARGKASIGPADTEKARRRLEGLVKAGRLVKEHDGLGRGHGARYLPFELEDLTIQDEA